MENDQLIPERRNVDADAPEEASAPTAGSECSIGEARCSVPKKKKIPRELMEFILRAAATAIVLWIFLTFVFGIYICHSDACYPMLKDGDLCVTWRPSAPAQRNLIVYEHGGEICFGRVAALPGDRVEFSNDDVRVNGYIVQANAMTESSDGAVTGKFPLTVPEDSVFVLSDNLSDANDSRHFGPIPLSECRGSVVFLMRRRGF